MLYDRARLNALIFHNETVLPRTSPGFGEVSLAVAELQGGNYPKAAALAEIAVGKDPQLAAGWLAKTAADVFEATPDNLRQERAVFCMDRALDCAPGCHKEIVEFFVANILGHYVGLLCGSGTEMVSRWTELEALAKTAESQATQANLRATDLEVRSIQAQGDARRQEALGLVTGLTALFSHRTGTKVLSGLASAVSFSQAEQRNSDAALLGARADALNLAGREMQKAGGELRLAAAHHRAAAMLPLIPARDLIALAAQLLHAAGLPAVGLDPLIDRFIDAFQRVLSAHVTLFGQRSWPIFGNHPESQSVGWTLTRLLPWMKRGDLERLVSLNQPKQPQGGVLALLCLLLSFFLEVWTVTIFCSALVNLFAAYGGHSQHTLGGTSFGLLVAAGVLFGLDAGVRGRFAGSGGHLRSRTKRPAATATFSGMACSADRRPGNFARRSYRPRFLAPATRVSPRLRACCLAEWRQVSSGRRVLWVPSFWACSCSGRYRLRRRVLR